MPAQSKNTHFANLEATIMIRSIEVNSVEELPTLTEENRGSYALVGRSWLRRRYTFVWLTPRNAEPHGQWLFCCLEEMN